MTNVIVAFLSTQAGAAVLVALGGAAITSAAHLVVAAFQKDRRLANLAKVVQIARDVALKVLEVAAKSPPDQRLRLALAEARREVLAQLPDIEKSLEAELDTLIHGTVLLELAPGGCAVNMPSPVPTQGAK